MTTTTVPKKTPLALQATQAGFKLLSGVAPCVAARAAQNLFCTPRSFDRPRREAELIARAEPFPIRAGLTQLAGWTWGAGPAVLLVHGWEGRGSQLAPFVDPLVEAGYRVITWDAPAHGDSPGKQSSLVEFADAIWAAGRAARDVHAVIAHSLGCGAAGMAFGEGFPARRAVFVSSPSNLAEYTDKFSRIIGLSRGAQRRMVRSMERRFHVRMDELSVEHYALPEDVPLLVVHDKDDRDVEWQHGRQVAETWPGAELMLTEGHGHRRVLRAPEVVARTVDWVSA